ncbi:phage tail protein [Algimonas porphyrae]|uniref:Tail assembly protein n=1 Tax=Algimonas porphyrae TaxID=1128113 RepID=A0ABQ5V0C0_9PROT|nr:phage tail protein [Algimonas porphyrae]GLQ20517.1 tail assembly protein [Algimonas porphyrae]
MSETMLALGDFRFAIGTAAYQTLTRTRRYNWTEQGRVGRRPALQFLGRGSETIQLEGVIYPHFRGGLDQVARMDAIAGQGDPMLLVDGRGFNHGSWAVREISEVKSHIDESGIAFKQSFTVHLICYSGADEARGQ